MDDFKYQLTIAKIRDAKYIKDLNTIMYEIYMTTPGANRYYDKLITDKSLINNYKAFSYVLNRFQSKSTTKALVKYTDWMVRVQGNLLSQYNKEDNWTYEEFLDLFEYDTIINISSSALNETQLTNLARVVGENVPNLSFNVTYSTYHLGSSRLFRMSATEGAMDELLKVDIWAIDHNLSPANTIYKTFRKIFHDRESISESASIALQEHTQLFQSAIQAINNYRASHEQQ
jgi:hypothetical protein